MIPLPSYIDSEAWADYCAMRSKDKKAMTMRVARQKLARLMEFHAKGHDVNAIIDAATNGHWLDFYEPKENPISDVRPREVLEKAAKDAEAARLAEYIARTTGTIRRVA